MDFPVKLGREDKLFYMGKIEAALGLVLASGHLMGIQPSPNSISRSLANAILESVNTVKQANLAISFLKSKILQDISGDNEH